MSGFTSYHVDLTVKIYVDVTVKKVVGVHLQQQFLDEMGVSRSFTVWLLA